MLKNNILGVLGHLFLVLFVFIFLSLVHKGSTTAQFFYSGMIAKVFFTLVSFVFYWFSGKLMSRNTRWPGVLFPGIGILLIAFLCSVVGFSGLGSHWLAKDVGESMWRFPLEIFLLPQYVILTLWKLPKLELTLFSLSFAPGLIYTLSILQGKLKRNHRKRKREIRT